MNGEHQTIKSFMNYDADWDLVVPTAKMYNNKNNLYSTENIPNTMKIYSI